MGGQCDKDYRHAPLWCSICWDNMQQARQATALEKLTQTVAELAGTASLLNEGVDDPGRLPKPQPKSRPSPVPPPNPGIGAYKWKA